jgi:hypothetical protein
MTLDTNTSEPASSGPMRMKKRVVRVTGITETDPDEARKFLETSISNELTQQEKDEQIIQSISIVPSCEPEKLKMVGIVDFLRMPSFLEDIDNSTLSIDTEDDLTFDSHFHGFTQLYPSHGAQME